MNEATSKKKAFEYKLGAAKYHLKQMQSIFKEYNQLLFKWSNDPKSRAPAKIIPFFYHHDAFLYELSSCFDMMLYYLASKYNLQVSEKDIGWGKKYKDELEQKYPVVYRTVSKEYDEWWFEDLRTARNYIAHHDSPPLGLEYIDKGITLLFFYIPRLHQRREMFEQCDIWRSKISGLFKSVEKIN